MAIGGSTLFSAWLNFSRQRLPLGELFFFFFFPAILFEAQIGKSPLSLGNAQ